MPLLLIGLGLLAGLAIAAALDREKPEVRASKASVGAVPDRPPLAYKGDPIASLPQERWGKVECVARRGDGYVYGCRLSNGRAVVLTDDDVVR